MQETVSGMWHQLGHMQVSTSLQTDNHASTPPLSYLQAGCPSCSPTNSVEALTLTLARSHSPNLTLNPIRRLTVTTLTLTPNLNSSHNNPYPNAH